MSTALQRQRAREDALITASASGMRSARVMVQASPMKRPVYVSTPATQAQLAVVARQLETIIAAEHINPDTGEISTVEQTKRAVSLVDVMHKDEQIGMELHRAADKFRELFFEAMGPSKGISSYGEYTAASEPSKRIPTSPRQMQAYENLKKAAVAAFGTQRQDGRWAIDEQLMQLVVPAMLSDKKSVTQGNIGQQRSRYNGSAQVRAVGGMVVQEVLQRLSLHFQYRER